jgi:hypothetical protein
MNQKKEEKAQAKRDELVKLVKSGKSAEGKNVGLRDANKSVKVVTINTKPSLCDQSYKDKVNVNKIVEKAMKTGRLDHMRNEDGTFKDISEQPDLRDGLLKLKHAKEIFMQLPEKVRRVASSPQALLDYLANPENNAEAVKLGLKKESVLAESKAKEIKTDEPKTESKQDGDAK